MTFEDGRVRHLYEPRDGEVVVVSRRTAEHVYRARGERVGVTLEAKVPTVIHAAAARQLSGDGVEIVDEPAGEVPRRVRLLPRERGWWTEERVVAS